MSEQDDDQPQLSEKIGALLDKPLLDLLEEAYPLRSQVASLTDTDRQVGVKIGQRELIDFLRRCFDEINPKAL